MKILMQSAHNNSVYGFSNTLCSSYYYYCCCCDVCLKSTWGCVSWRQCNSQQQSPHALRQSPNYAQSGLWKYGCWLNHCTTAFCTLTCNVNFRIFLNSPQQWQLHGSKKGRVTDVWEPPITWHLLVLNSVGHMDQADVCSKFTPELRTK